MPENTYTISPTLNKNKVFLLQKSEVEKRLDPDYYHLERRFEIERLKKAKHLLENLKSTASFPKIILTANPDNLPYIGLEDIESNSGVYSNNSEKENFGTALYFKTGNVLFPKLRPYLNKVHLAEFDGICSTEFVILNSKKVSAQFLSAFLRSSIVVNQTKHMMSGNTLPRLQTEDIENILVPIPDEATQNKVFSLMDLALKTKKQNEAQAKKLLASIDDYLLKELGIDLPKPPENILKNRLFITTIKEISGGRFDPNYHQSNHKENYISFHKSKFQTQFLKDITESIFQGVGRNIDENSEYVLLKVKNIKQSCEIDYEDTEKIGDFQTSKLLKKGDIITPCIGEAVRQIKFVVFENENGKYLVDNNTCVIRPNKKVNSNFINYCLCSSIGRLQINRLIGGGGVPFLGADNLKKFIISVPPLARQEEIAEHITTIRKQAQQLKNKTKEALEKAGKEIESILLS